MILHFGKINDFNGEKCLNKHRLKSNHVYTTEVFKKLVLVQGEAKPECPLASGSEAEVRTRVKAFEGVHRKSPATGCGKQMLPHCGVPTEAGFPHQPWSGSGGWY